MTKVVLKMAIRTAVAVLLCCSASAFSPLMCDSGASHNSAASRRSIDSKPAGMPSPGVGRRESFMTFIKGAGAVVVGEAVLTEIAEAGAVRAAATLGAEEVGEVAGVGAAAEGAAALRNGRVVFGEMEKQLFGKSIHLP